MNLQAIAAELEFLAWRDAQLREISLQLEAAFPALLDDLERQVNDAPTSDLVFSRSLLGSKAESLIKDWSARQLTAALARAEVELEHTLRKLPDPLSLDPASREQVIAALPVLAGVGLIGASLAAVPPLISFARVGATALTFLATGTISWPLLVLGAIGTGVTALAGRQALKFAHDEARSRLCMRFQRAAQRQVFGIGRKPDERCTLSDIQAAVLQAGRRRIQGDD